MQNSDIYSLMQTKTPYKSYIKAILGKVYITVLDPFSNKPEGKILSGNPRNHDSDCIVEIWSEKEDVFFKRMNKRHFEMGNLVEYRRPDRPEEKNPNEISDDEIIELLGSKFLSLQSRVNKMTSPAPVFRVLTLAQELEKSEKIIKFIEGKLASIQALEYESNLGEK